MKKGLIQKIFLGLMIFVIAFFGVEILREFNSNHTYYQTMFTTMKNWWTVIAAILSSLIPTLYILFKHKKFSVPVFAIFLFVGLFVFGLTNLGIKGDIVFPTGVVPYLFNELILFLFGGFFLVGTLALGTRLSKLIFKFKENRIQEMFLNFGIGLGALLILRQILIGFGLLHPAVSWILFLGFGFFIWHEKEHLKSYNNILGEAFDSFNSEGNNRWKYILLVLIVFSLTYYFYGFQLSFIPYSTAWDANHEYMYIPKVIAENHGLIWGNMGVANKMPFLWHTFISFWFSIGSVFSGNWLAPDTIAVSMNFLSGPLCLIFGLLLIKEVLDFFIPKNDDEDAAKGVSFATGWATLLLWLCSGMGAFLIFVDNKTDLGVMALTILAMLSGFVFIRYIAEHKGKGIIDRESVKYLVVSGIFFAFSCMAKPTAFIDVTIFGVLLCALWLNSFIGLGVGLIGLGFMGILKPLYASQFMTVSLGKWFILIGLIVSIFGVVMMFIRQNKEKVSIKSLFSYIVIWGVTLVCSLIVFKGPWLAYSQIISHKFSIGNWGKGLLMSYNIDEGKINDIRGKNLVLLATTSESIDLQRQNEVDKKYLEGLENGESLIITSGDESSEQLYTDVITPDQCSLIEYSDEELQEGLQSAPVGNEDFGRYVGYGWKEFTHTNRLSYKLLRLFYPKDGKCYGANADAKILCENQSAINNGDINVIKNIQLNEGTPAYEILQSGLIDYNENPDTLMDLVSNLKTYYQDHSIYTQNGKMYIPYRYVVPLNIVFNRSLQNLSSYYTDIGFVWMFVFIFIILSFIYSIIKKDRKLFALSMATIIGRAIWRVIGSAILWYGVGLLMWTALVIAMYVRDLLKGKDRVINILGVFALGLFGVIVVMQFFYNFIRISSQGSSGPFLWYKQSVGNVDVIENDLSVSQKVKIGYSKKDVFDLQFPQYNRFIEYVKDRNDKDGVLIAGTYIQYFLDNQRNIKMDGNLSRFWEKGSDGDVCKMYQRLRNANIKYLVIDPNIASIVMGEGNKSLFYRFFAKENDNGKIIEKGALMMLSELIDQGYAKLLYSNNLGATYGFTLSDTDLQSVFGEMSKDDLVYLRAQLAAARYMDNASDLINGIWYIFNDRVGNGGAIQDLADVYGKQIELGNLIKAVNEYISNPQFAPQSTSELTDDEKFILYYFIYLYKLSQNQNSSQYQNFVNNIFSMSIAGGSQLIVVELL